MGRGFREPGTTDLQFRKPGGLRGLRQLTKKTMFERVFTNWRTSVLGIVLMCASFAFVFWEKATLTEAGAFLGVAFTLFFVKDPKQKS